MGGASVCVGRSVAEGEVAVPAAGGRWRWRWGFVRVGGRFKLVNIMGFGHYFFNCKVYNTLHPFSKKNDAAGCTFF